MDGLSRMLTSALAILLLLLIGPSVSWIHHLTGRRTTTRHRWATAPTGRHPVPSALPLPLPLPSATASRLWADANPSSSASAAAADDDDDGPDMGFNELHTVLRDAVRQQDFDAAARASDRLLRRLFGAEAVAAMDAEERRARRRGMTWAAGAVPWLADRLEALNYTFPTTIQVHAMAAVNAMLAGRGDTGATATAAGIGVGGAGNATAGASLAERVGVGGSDMGLVVSGATGSGKTLAYLVPMLSALSDTLFRRQRIRVGSEERVGDITGNLLERISVVTSPVVRSSDRSPRRRGAIATGTAIATLGESGTDVTSPVALLVVPTRELGVQISMLLYQLVGGNIKDDPTQRSGGANFFRFKGPKGVRIGCVLDDEDASFGLKLQTDVAIVTPKYLDKLLEEGDITPAMLRTIVFDEADLDLELTNSTTLVRLFEDEDEREYSRLTFLVGASVTKALGNMAVSNRLIPEGRSYIATSTSYVPLVAESLAELGIDEEKTKTASLTDLDVCLQPGLKHERAVYKGNNYTGLLSLSRLLRKELKDYNDAVAAGNPPAQRPRVVIFFPDEDTARAAVEPLRDALWGDHWLCVLLPKTGVRPLTIMDQFKRNQTSVMLATANSVRGLDFPALTHVYAMYLPMDDPREYIHLAGRVGRVGQQGAVSGDGAHVVSVLPEEDAFKLDELAKSLGFQFSDIEVPVETLERTDEGLIDVEKNDVERMRRYLEDALTFSMLDKDEIDYASISDEAVRNYVIGDDQDDDQDEDDEEFDSEDADFDDENVLQ